MIYSSISSWATTEGVGERATIPEEINKKIKDLEQVSKARVHTIGEGIDAYWLMSKDLDSRVDDFFHKISHD